MTEDGLPLEVLEGQLDTYELLKAMYPEIGEEEADNDSEAIVSGLRQWLDTDKSPSHMPQLPDSLPLVIKLNINDSGSQDQSILINVSLPLGQLAEESTYEDDGICLYKIRVSTPDWLTKNETNLLIQDLPQDDVVSAIEHITRLAQEAALTASLQTSTIKSTASAGPLVRVWFYFPSISTRAKRDDIVNYAPSYGLTGFLLAGKPGILCLEGVAQDIDDYMKFIKTESWGDIPSGHKKVSERLREETSGLERVFAGMEEITDSIEKRGARGNRGNMQAVEAWLSERGLKDQLGKVLM